VTTDQEVLDAVNAGRWETVPDGYVMKPGDVVRHTQIVSIAPKTGAWRLFRLYPEDVVTETFERLAADQ
jgi:hypothetical protein